MNTLVRLGGTCIVLGVSLGMTIDALAAEQLPEITVEAGPVNKTIVGRAFGSGAPVEQITVDYHVNYVDLDLVKHSNVVTLNERIRAAAEDACKQLDELYPIERPKLRECTDEAVRGASAQVQKAIATAQNRSGT